MKRYLQILIKCISIIILGVVWSYTAKYINNPLIFPSVKDVSIAIKNLFLEGVFFQIIGNTLMKLILVIFLISIISVILGSLSFKYQIFKELIAPYINIIKAIPTVVLILIVLIWYDAKFVPIVATTVIVLPILYDNILNGLESMDSNIVKMSRIFKVSKRRQILELYFPAVYYSIAGAIHSLIGLAFKVIIAGEILAQQNNSIGGEILLNKIYLEGANVFAWVVVVITLNFSIEKVVILINNKLLSWR